MPSRSHQLSHPLEFKNSARVNMAEGGRPQQRLVSKKGKTNYAVWEQFGFEESDDEQKHATCRICYMVVAATHGNTTNLFTHLKIKHRVTYDNLIKKQPSTTPSKSSMTQASMTDTLYSTTPYPLNSERHKKITDSVAYYLAKDMRPTSIVDNPGFKKMVNPLDKRYALPSRHHFSRVAMPYLYNKCHAEVANEVTKAEYFAITTDLWSSRTMEPYISLTIHYIDADFRLNTKCLQTAFIPEDHTGQNIANGLREALAAFKQRKANLHYFGQCLKHKAGGRAKWMDKASVLRAQIHLAIGECYRK